MLSQTTVEELRQILKEEYGKDVSQADASEIAHTLVGYFDLLANIYHREKTENNNDTNNNHDNQRISNKE
jgi:hypothetical protein